MTSRQARAERDVALRYITRDGRPGMTWACKVVEDREDLVALYIPQGTPHKRWTRRGGERVLADVPWMMHTLRLMFPGRGHSVWLNWADEHEFVGYYVNLEEPFRRTPIGLDTNDHTLDVVVAPDLSWSWKDAELLAERERRGDYSTALVDEIREEANLVIRAIERREPPFSDGWEAWRPDPAWSPPRLPEDWNTEPPALWDRRLWAYPHAADRSRSESG